MGKPIEKSEKKISVGMKILAGLTIASAVVEALYRVAGKLGAERGLSWQVWVTKVRDVNLVMVLPLLLLLLANEARPFEENVWVCYRRKGIFFRTPGELEDGDRQRHLEEKYGCGFTALGEKDEFGETLFGEAGHPDVAVSVRLAGWELLDNYVEGLAVHYLTEGYRERGIMRAAEIKTWHMAPYFCLSLEDEGDVEAFSEDVGRLIEYVVSSTPFFEAHRGILYFIHVEGKQEFTGGIPFGRLGTYDVLEEGYWTETENIAELVAQRYKEGVEHAARKQEYEDSLEASREMEGAPYPGASLFQRNFSCIMAEV